MHPYALSIVADLAAAIAAHARDPAARVHRGRYRPHRPDEDRAALPEHLLDIDGLPEGGCIHGCHRLR
jgi:hypothetical protein